jgi:acetyl esterase/lipase
MTNRAPSTGGADPALRTPAGEETEKVVPLYDGPAPGSEHWRRHEQEIKGEPGKPRIVFNVARPTLTVFEPEAGKATGAAAVICPGGGFFLLSIDNEGFEVARHLAARGVTCFVLKYRLVQCRTDNPRLEVLLGSIYEQKVAPIRKLALADGLAAMTYVRRHCKEYAIDPGRIGIIGFSAGGAVAGSVGIHYTPDSRPDFVAPIYPSSDSGITAEAVPPDAPPLFASAVTDDRLKLAPQAVSLYHAWATAGRCAELHVYAQGGHGFGMKKQNLPCDTWTDRFADWLLMHDLLSK